MTTTTHSSGRHPSHLVSIIYVDGALGNMDEYRRLSCYGAFEVTCVDNEPVFTAHHMSTTDNELRKTMMRQLGELSHDRHVVLGSSKAHDTFWDRRHILEAGLVYLDILEELQAVKPSNFHLMGAPEEAMIELASTFGLNNCYSNDLLAQARCAGVRAQLVWLAYVATTLGRMEARNLFAAFQAWQVLEMARPLPF